MGKIEYDDLKKGLLANRNGKKAEISLKFEAEYPCLSALLCSNYSPQAKKPNASVAFHWEGGSWSVCLAWKKEKMVGWTFVTDLTDLLSTVESQLEEGSIVWKDSKW